MSIETRLSLSQISGEGSELNVLKYEGRFTRSDLYAISLQILGVEHATIPHIKAMDVPFHMGYSGLICSKALQKDRPK